MRPVPFADTRKTLLARVWRLISDEGFAVCMLIAVTTAAVLAFGFDATPDIVVAVLTLGAVTALAETRLHRRG